MKDVRVRLEKLTALTALGVAVGGGGAVHQPPKPIVAAVSLVTLNWQVSAALRLLTCTSNPRLDAIRPVDCKPRPLRGANSST